MSEMSEMSEIRIPDVYDDEDDAFDAEPHNYNCCCEDCLQNYPERDVLYNDGRYYNGYDDLEEDRDDDLVEGA